MSKISIVTLMDSAIKLYTTFEEKNAYFSTKTATLKEIQTKLQNSPPIEFKNETTEQRDAEQKTFLLNLAAQELQKLESDLNSWSNTLTLRNFFGSHGNLPSLVAILHYCATIESKSAQDADKIYQLLQSAKKSFESVKEEFKHFCNLVVRFCFEEKSFFVENLYEPSSDDILLVLDTQQKLDAAERARQKASDALIAHLCDFNTLKEEYKNSVEVTMSLETQICSLKEEVEKRKNAESLNATKAKGFEASKDSLEIANKELNEKCVRMQDKLVILETDRAANESNEVKRLRNQNEILQNENKQLKDLIKKSPALRGALTDGDPLASMFRTNSIFSVPKPNPVGLSTVIAPQQPPTHKAN